MRSGILFASVFVVLMVLKPVVVSTPGRVMATSLFVSCLYPIALALTTSISASVLGRRHVGWLDLAVAYALFAPAALAIHPVALTLGSAAAAVHILYAISVSAELAAPIKS